MEETEKLLKALELIEESIVFPAGSAIVFKDNRDNSNLYSCLWHNTTGKPQACEKPPEEYLNVTLEKAEEICKKYESPMILTFALHLPIRKTALYE